MRGGVGVRVRVAGQVLFSCCRVEWSGCGWSEAWGRQTETRGPWAMLGATAQLHVKGASLEGPTGRPGDPGEQGVRGATGGLSPGVSAERQLFPVA